MALSAIPVLNINDSGPGSLRQAITDANGSVGIDSIVLSIPGTSPHVITPLTALPALSDSVVLDATTQLGYSGTPLIELDGSMVTGGASGLHIVADDSMVLGFAIHRFAVESGGRQGHGIYVDHADRTIIQGNYLGTDATGTVALGNYDGMWLSAGASGNAIGTNGDGVSDAEERNLISGNIRRGVRLEGAGNVDNVIAGNYIGTDISGTADLGNGWEGIAIIGSANSVTESNLIGTNGDGVHDDVERNVISGNDRSGVMISHAFQNVVAGNFIGTDATGLFPLSNVGVGVFLSNQSSGNLIGTDGDGVADHAERNLISGNAGILIRDAADNVIAGNDIWTDVTGVGLIGSSGHGITIRSAASTGNRIGTNADGVADAAEGNVIGGQRFAGIWIQDASNTSIGNLPPVFEAGSNEFLPPSLKGEFLRSSIPFSDPGADSWSGTVDYGDGSSEQTLTIDPISKSFSLEHVFADGGDFTVVVNLVDDDGGSFTDSFVVSVVLNTAPEARDDVISVAANDVIVIDVLSDNGNGPDFDLQNNLVSSLTVATSSPERGALENLGDGKFLFNPESDFDALASGESGSVSFQYRVVDSFGASDSASVTINVIGVNQPPSLLNVLSSSPNIDTKSIDGNVTIAGVFSDVDSSDIHTVMLDWGDGTLPETASVDQLANSFFASHQYDRGGIFPVTVMLFDNAGESDVIVTQVVTQGAGFVDGTLYVIASSGDDRIRIRQVNEMVHATLWLDSPPSRGVSHSIDVSSANVTQIFVFACDGNDWVKIQVNDDVPVEVTAGAGHDFIWTAGGNDRVFGGAGNDMIRTYAGNDFVDAGDGDDFVWSGSGDDIIYSGAGIDRVLSGSGNDIVFGGEGGDFLYGQEGNDILFGSNDEDHLDGGPGNDVLAGEQRSNTLTSRNNLLIDVFFGSTRKSNADAQAFDSLLTLWAQGNLDETLDALAGMREDLRAI